MDGPSRRRQAIRLSTPARSTSPSGEASTGFDEFSLRPELRRAVADAGYDSPRPIQERALPAALEGRDVLGLAQTGTGKTAAFALPVLQRLLDRPGRGPRALVVTPTRELASQIALEFERLARHTDLTCLAVFGGVPVPRHVRALQQKPDVLVACPGRLLDLLSQRALRLDGIEVLVLDEADHMFDMGFLPDVRRILKALPQRRQNLLFSATMPREVRGLADGVLHRPVVVELEHSRPAETIAHALYPVPGGDRNGALDRLLAREDMTSAIVFVRTKRRAKRLAQRLANRRLAAVALQGNMSQNQRERALQGFRDGRFRILVATDVAARGLDIAGVSHVINYDVPTTPDAYTHRIGRTGRSERQGTAITLVTGEDREAVGAIERKLGARVPQWDPERASARPVASAPAPAPAPAAEAAPEPGEGRRKRSRRRSRNRSAESAEPQGARETASPEQEPESRPRREPRARRERTPRQPERQPQETARPEAPALPASGTPFGLGVL